MMPVYQIDSVKRALLFNQLLLGCESIISYIREREKEREAELEG